MKQVLDLLRHFIIPSEKNNFKARALHIDYLSLYLAFTLVILVGIKSFFPQFYNVLGFATDISIDKLNELVNKQRIQNNLTPLKLNNELSQAAEKKARDMFEKNYWAHYSPTGATPWDFILSTHYSYEYAGENLAKNFLFSQNTVDAWMNSPTHRDNILKSEYEDVGYAVVNGILNGEETTLVVQMFGKPNNKQISAVSELIQPKTVSAEEINSITKTNSIPSAQTKKTNQTFALPITLKTTYAFIFILIGILLVDFVVAAKMNIIRISSKNLAHIIFLSAIAIGIYILVTKGSII